MLILLLFAFISGLITILAPCIWPLLPIVFSSSSTGGKRKPLGITLGIMTSFTIFTLTLSYIVKIIPFDPNILRLFAVIVISFFGLTLIIPALNQVVEGAVSRLGTKLGNGRGKNGDGFAGGFVTGFSLGIVWAPCAGPILATIATLAATTAVNFQVVLVTVAYVIGVGIPLFLFSTVGNRIFSQSKKFNKYTGRIQQVFGVIMLLTALAIFTNFDKTVQVRLLEFFPSYSNFVNQIESNPAVKNQLDRLKNNGSSLTTSQEGGVGNQAPEFTGITKWLNTDKPLTMGYLKGKVVLVDFWTYTCINCIRTLPHITAWYDKYKDQGFVVIGVHTPEFEFEKNTANVQDAIKRFNIHYPVAQDNNYGTWQNYNNHYWPAHYLIDANGIVRDYHAGEGNYEETEKEIQALLKEAGKNVDTSLFTSRDMTPTSPVSPETYLGLARLERFASGELPQLGDQTYSALESIPLHYFAYTGKWNLSQQYGQSYKGSTLQFHFSAGHVYLVMQPSQKGSTVKVFLDGKGVSPNQSGADVKNGIVTLDGNRLYDLIDLKGKTEDHTLKLEFQDDAVQVFAFTFG